MVLGDVFRGGSSMRTMREEDKKRGAFCLRYICIPGQQTLLSQDIRSSIASHPNGK